jgi:hypothetical protein
MAFSQKKQVLPAVGNMPVPVHGAVATTDSESGPAKVTLENTGAADVEDPVMEFNISGIIGA